MKEKIYKKLGRIILADNIATTWEIKCYKFAAEIELLINQEVEKRIKERMPSEDEMDNEVDNRYPNVANPHIFGKQLGFGDCYFWLHSCLTCSEKPNNSQKTEGGEE